MSVLAVWSILWYLRGLALGAKHESAFVWSRSIEAWARLGLAIVLLSVGWGLTGVLAAVTAGGLLAAALLVRQLRLRPDVLTATPTTSHSDWLVGFLKTAALYLPLALFLRLDVILAPQVLAQIDQGGFAAAGVVGKAIMLYSLGLTPLMFPYFVGVTERVELQRIMRLGIIVPTATLIATSAAFALWGHEIVALAFGAEYAAAAGILPWYLLAMVPLALNVVVVHLLMARCGWKTAVLVWGALGLYWLVLRLSPATVTGLLAGMAGFSLIAGLCGMLIAYRALLSRASADSQTDLRDRYSSRLLPLSSDR